MIRTIENFHSPRFSYPNSTEFVDLMVKFKEIDVEIPYTVGSIDEAPWGKELYKRVVENKEAGEILPFNKDYVLAPVILDKI